MKTQTLIDGIRTISENYRTEYTTTEMHIMGEEVRDLPDEMMAEAVKVIILNNNSRPTPGKIVDTIKRLATDKQMAWAKAQDDEQVARADRARSGQRSPAYNEPMTEMGKEALRISARLAKGEISRKEWAEGWMFFLQTYPNDRAEAMLRLYMTQVDKYKTQPWARPGQYDMDKPVGSR